MLTFWVVASDHENIRAAVRHRTFESACMEAQRLAALHHGSFFVLECVGVAKPATPPIEWVRAFVDDSF